MRGDHQRRAITSAAPPLAPTTFTPTAMSDAPATAYMLRETPRHERLPTTFEWWVCCDCGGATSAVPQNVGALIKDSLFAKFIR